MDGAVVQNQPASTDHIRLYITPFNQPLLNKIIPTSLQSQVSHLSFHGVETFPEHGFGYVNLPVMEAQKLKKRLNGSTLKGAKVRIEDARPEKIRQSPEVDDSIEHKTRKQARRDSRDKEERVLHGHELEEGRHVKRGWSEKASEKRAKTNEQNDDSRAESIEGKKLRFKTKLRTNMAPPELKSKHSKAKMKDGKEKKSKKSTVVEEFSNTTKLNAGGKASGKRSAAFVDGKGWLDEDGKVVEPEPPSKRRRGKHPVGPEEQSESIPVEKFGKEDSRQKYGSATDKFNARESLSRSEDTTSDEDQQKSEKEAAETSESPNEILIRKQNLAEKDTSKPDRDVHPLEALFKRPGGDKPKIPAPINTSFSFFDMAEADSREKKDAGLPPQTPHTKRDLEWRSIRSAAPTPDTAAIGKRFNFTPHRREEEEDGARENNPSPSPVEGVDPVGSEQDKQEESGFRKWFYDNRGDLNRSWKKRRREERKLERQRESRRLSRKLA